MDNLIEVFRNKLNRILNEIGVENVENNSFLIITTTDKENYTTWDDYYRLWSTPTFKGIRLKFDDILDCLVKKEKNTIPLWIKVTYVYHKPVILEISQRFRKLKEVLERNPENTFAPFEITKRDDIDQIVNSERAEAIRILMHKRLLDNRIRNLIGDQIDISELKENLISHLNNYRFYPPNPSHQKQEDLNYSELVINQDYQTGEFSICKAENLEEEIESKLTKNLAIDLYLKRMITNEFCGIKIKHRA